MKTTFVGDDNKNQEKHNKAHQGDEEKVHIAGLKGGQRVKMVETEITDEPSVIVDAEGVKTTKDKKIVEKIRGKKYKESKAKLDHEKFYKVSEAVDLVKKASYSKFDGTMELHIIVKKTGTSAQVTLPHQAGRTKKVEVASDDTLAKLKEGKIDFDILVATTEMMPKLVPFARLLGPKGLMPNPKNGTLVSDSKKAKSFSTGTITIKTEKEAPLVHTVVGKVSQKDEEITENIEAILKALGGGKGIVRVFLKSTMSPAAKISIK